MKRLRGQKMFRLRQDNAMLNRQDYAVESWVAARRADRTRASYTANWNKEERLMQEREPCYPGTGASAGNTGTHGWPSLDGETAEKWQLQWIKLMWPVPRLHKYSYG